MSLENASGGFTDLDELGRNKTLVVVRIREFHAEETSTEGYKSQPVTGDLLICDGHRVGEVTRGMKFKKGGVTPTLRRSAPGKDVAGVFQVKEHPTRTDRATGKPQLFVSLDPVTPEQMDTIKGVYKDGTGFDENSNLVSAAAAPATSGTGGNYTATERPPF